MSIENFSTPPFEGRYLFVSGLHRSGTSLLAAMIARHPDVSAMTETGVPENEGVFLQGAIPHTAAHGVPGAFAFDDAQHLTEESRYNTLETSQRMRRDWSPHFAEGAAWRMEKSPVNMLRTRLYQQLFPRAHFIVVTRHPVAVAQATRKWSDRPLEALVEHWRVAHARFLADFDHLHCALVVRYEDLIADPGGAMRRVHAFLDLEPPAGRGRFGVFDGNAKYDAGNGLELPAEARRLGYRPGLGVEAVPEDMALCRHYLRAVRDGVGACAPSGRRAKRANMCWDGASDAWEDARQVSVDSV